LPAEERPRLIVITEQTLLVVENSDGDKAPDTSEAMDLRSLDGVINIDRLVELASKHIDDSTA